ncbi:hypothetical protein NX059_005011 [Plenodomus lindquistii]|nr:hypothetical protein NX059_005011 [Plenodomus lindquistii]
MYSTTHHHNARHAILTSTPTCHCFWTKGARDDKNTITQRNSGMRFHPSIAQSAWARDLHVSAKLRPETHNHSRPLDILNYGCSRMAPGDDATDWPGFSIY